MEDKQRLLITITDEQRRALEAIRVLSKPMPSISELIRRAIDEFVKRVLNTD